MGRYANDAFIGNFDCHFIFPSELFKNKDKEFLHSIFQQR